MGRFESNSAAGRVAAIFGGIGIGAALMYVFDPDRGRRRRAMAREQAVALANKAGRALASTSRDLTNRARGAASEVRSSFGATPSTRSPGERLAQHERAHKASSPEAHTRPPLEAASPEEGEL